MYRTSQFKLNPSNPRVIKDDRFKKLCESIKTFPEMLSKRPLVCVTDIDGKFYPLGGNMRLKAIQEIGYKEIPDSWIMLADDWPEEKRREFIIKDNVGFGEWDWDTLSNEWDLVKLEEWGLEIPDFTTEIEEEEGQDDAPEVLNQITEKGDVWEFNNHRLVCGSSCEVQDIDKLMDGKKADLIFTDPPYDLKDEYSNLILGCAKDDCHVFIMNSDKLLIENIKNNQEYFRKMFYVDFRQARLVSNNQPMTRVDPIAEFLKGKGKFNNLRDGFSTLIECAKIHNNNQEQNHGFNQAKRVELPETFILHYSQPNELVCDFFGGAGSTLIAAEKNNRNAYLMEFDPKHCDIILKRWIQYMVQHSKLLEVKKNGVKQDIEQLYNSLEINKLAIQKK
jgi:DNA modification methylase